MKSQKIENNVPMFSMNKDAKMINTVLANKIQQYIKRIINYDQVGFIPEAQMSFNGWMDKLWYIHKKEQTIDTCNNLNGSWMYYTEGEKSTSKD